MNGSWEDFRAGVHIFMSNFNARFGWLVPLLVVLAVVGVLGFACIRALLARRGGQKCASPLRIRQADAKLTARAVENLAAAVAVPTVTGDRAAMDRLHDELRKRYAATLSALDATVTSDGSLLMCWHGRESKKNAPVLFCGHLDVVPPGPGWSGEPFSGKRSGGMIHGRGSIDCKATVIALLEAVTNLRDAGYKPERDVYFAFGADEETGGTRGAKNIAEMMRKRDLHFALVLDEGSYITERHLGIREHAAALVALGEKRSCDYRLTATAPAGHSSTPGRVTALGSLAEALCRMERAQPHHRLLPVVTRYLKEDAMPLLAFGKRFVICNLPVTGPLLTRVFRDKPGLLALMRSTLAVTQAEGAPAPNILPHTAVGMVNARLLPGDDPQELLERMQALVADLPVRVELVRDGGGCDVSSPDSEGYRLLEGALHEAFPQMPVIPTLATGAMDCRWYAPMSDCALRFTPIVRGDKENAGVHGIDEALSEQTLGLAVEVYMTLMRRL